MEIKDKRIIITGASSGVGKELVKQTLMLGAHVVGVDINKDGLKTLEEEMNSNKLKTYPLDVSSGDEIVKFRKWYDENMDDLDILINNAGIIQPFKKFDELDDATINRVMNINFFGPVKLIQTFMDLLKRRKDTYIVNVGSMGGFFPFPKQTIYGASKAALKIFTEGLYAELSESKTKVMIVLPGGMATNITQNSNVDTGNKTAKNSSYKLTSASEAASEIILGIEKNKFKIFIGKDAKFMKFLYKLNSKKAIDTINKKMRDL